MFNTIYIGMPNAGVHEASHKLVALSNVMQDTICPLGIPNERAPFASQR